MTPWQRIWREGRGWLAWKLLRWALVTFHPADPDRQRYADYLVQFAQESISAEIRSSWRVL